MPKYLPETALLKAKNFTKSLIKHKGNVEAMAKAEGVSKQSIYDRREHLQHYTFPQVMNNVGMSDLYLARKIKAGTEAVRVIAVGEKTKEVPDMPTRHKYLVTALQCKKYIGDNPEGSNGNIQAIVINFLSSPDKFLNPDEIKVMETLSAKGNSEQS
jgi:hypothetical protein